MIRISQLKLPVEHGEEAILTKAAKLLHIQASQVKQIRIVKQSIDARKKDQIVYIYTVELELLTGKESELVKKARNTNIVIGKQPSYTFPSPGQGSLSHPPVVIGSGPAGLICTLMLARAGYAPILLERGEDVDSRSKKVNRFWQGGPLDPQSNVQFGEGGAGTFSDGKLNTLVKDVSMRNQKVLELLVEAGADPAILYESKPHIGTDVLSRVVKVLRSQILEAGGQVFFSSQVTDLLLEGGRLKGVIINGQQTLSCQVAVLAIGHSARDTFEMLDRRGVSMEAKPFAVGLRIQHPQAMINRLQYGTVNPGRLLAASYKLTAKTSNNRGVYSFCMCPGGYVVDASSEANLLAINGMSNHSREGVNANSALIVTVSPADFESDHALAGVAYQRKLEQLAFCRGEGAVPIQLWGDFLQKKESGCLGDVDVQVKGRVCFASLHDLLPPYFYQSLSEGMEVFGRQLKGFDRYDAILAGVESRTSSPVRIHRDDRLQSPVQGLYPCGEGAGYAGGITSAAMDGLRVAEAIVCGYKPLMN